MARIGVFVAALLAAAALVIQSACMQPKPPNLVVATPNQLQVWLWDGRSAEYTQRCSAAVTRIASLATMDSLVYAADSRTVYILTPDLRVIKTWTCDTTPRQWIPALALAVHEDILFVRTSINLIALTRSLDSLGSVLVGQSPRPADIAFSGDTAFIVSTGWDDGIALVDVRNPGQLRLLGLLSSGTGVGPGSGTGKFLWLDPSLHEANLVRAGSGCLNPAEWQDVRHVRIPGDSVVWSTGPYRDELSPKRFWRGYAGNHQLPALWDDGPSTPAATGHPPRRSWWAYGTTKNPPIWMVTTIPESGATFYLSQVDRDKDSLRFVHSINLETATADETPMWATTCDLEARGRYVLVQTPSAYPYSAPGGLALFDVKREPRRLSVGSIAGVRVVAFATF